VIFSRGRGGRHAKADEAAGAPQGARGRAAPRDRDVDVEEPAAVGAAGRGFGPYDASDEPPEVPHLDLGALRIPAVEGVEVRMQAANDGTISQVVLVHETSVLQLAVIAAPRSDGVWDELRSEIRQQLFAEGAAAEEVDGVYGTELRARVRTPDGLTDLRFVGVDGPRWMVQAVFQGTVVADPDAAQPLINCLRGLVVHRGHEAMPVRTPLPLRLPRDVAEQAQAASEQAAAADGANGAAPAAPVVGVATASDGSELTGGDTVHPAPGGTVRGKPSPRPKRR